MFGGEAAIALIGSLLGLGTTAYSAYQNQRESKRQVNLERQKTKRNYAVLREAQIEREMGTGLESPMARKRIDSSEKKTMSEIGKMYDTSFWGNFLGGGGIKSSYNAFSKFNTYMGAAGKNTDLTNALKTGTQPTYSGEAVAYGLAASPMKMKPSNKINLIQK
jgi:hypothetical protein